MALARVKTWIDGETLTHTDLNAEFDNIVDNAASLFSPLTANLDADNFRITDLNAGTVGSPSFNPNGDSNTGIYFSAADTVDITAGGDRAASFNAATGTGVSYVATTPGATGVAPIIAGAGETNIGLTLDTDGTGALVINTGTTLRATIDANGIQPAGATASSFLYSDANSALATTSAPTNGQLLIGSTGAIPAVAAITATVPVTVTNGAGTIALAAPAYARTVTQLDVVSSNTETILFSFTIGAGDLGTNRAIRAVVMGDYLNNSGGSDVATFYVDYGTTAMYEDATIALGPDGQRVAFMIDVVIAAQNSASVQVLGGTIHIMQQGSADPTTGVGALDTAVKDSSTALTFAISWKHAASAATISIRRQYAYATIF
jgi:hypothetical protein